MLGLLLGVGSAEVAVRIVKPPPRAQVVRSGDEVEVYEQGGVPMWRNADPAWSALDAATCDDPSKRHLSFVGDSIFQVTGADWDANFTVSMARALGPDWCVHNSAQAGFTAPQKLVRAREQLSRHSPDVLIWEVWGEVDARRREL